MPLGSLATLKAIECGQGLAGAFAAKALADMGADVIKIEPPSGDRSRRTGPFPNDIPDPEQSGQFLYLNANKRGITLNLDTLRGRQILRELVQKVDILITDFPPPRLDELEIDYTAFQSINPHLIMACISPFGQTGPYRNYKGNDLIAWHVGAKGRDTPTSVTNLEEHPPLRGGGYQADYLTGWTAASSIMVAIFYREAYGVGQMIDISAMEAVANTLRPLFAQFSYDRTTIRSTRLGRGNLWVWPCKDGYISTSIAREHWWQALKELMGNPEWAENPAFADLASRRENADALEALIFEWLSHYTPQELYHMLTAKGIPCFPVNSIKDLMKSPQYRERQFFVVQEHPVAGKIRQPGPTIRYSKTPWQIRRPAPLLGQHNQEVYCDLLGYSHSDLVLLKRLGVV